MYLLITLSLLAGGHDPLYLQDNDLRDIRRFVPADAYVAVTTAPLAEIRHRTRESTWAEFFRDGAWFDATEALTEEVEAAVDQGRGPHPIDFINSVDGGLAFFVFPAKRSLGTCLLVDGGMSAEFALILDELLEELDKEDPLFLEHEGADLRVYRSDNGGREFHAVFYVDGILGFCSAPDQLVVVERCEQLIDSIGEPGGETGILFDPRYRNACAGGISQPSIAAFVSVGSLTERMLDQWGEIDPDRGRMFSVLGLSELEWLVAELDIGPGEKIDINLRMDMPANTLLGELVEFLGPAPREFLPLVPGESIGIGLHNYDLDGAFQHVKQFLAEWFPDGLDELESNMENSALEFGIDMEQDIFGQMTGRFADFTMILPESEIDPFGVLGSYQVLNQGSCFLVEVHEPEAVEETLETVLGMMGMEDAVETEEFQGEAVHELSVSGGFRMYWAFADKNLVVSSQPTPVHSVLMHAKTPDASSASEMVLFQREIKRHSEASMVKVTQTRSIIEGALGALEYLPILAMTGILGNAGKSDWIRTLAFMDWPSPSIAAQYFKGMLSFSVSTTGGVLDLTFAGR